MKHNITLKIKKSFKKEDPIEPQYAIKKMCQCKIMNMIIFSKKIPISEYSIVIFNDTIIIHNHKNTLTLVF